MTGWGVIPGMTYIRGVGNDTSKGQSLFFYMNIIIEIYQSVW